LVVSFKKFRNCGAIGHKAKDCKIKTNQMVVIIAEITTLFRNMQMMALTALIVAVQIILKAIVTN
jgi:hypothetical protein